MGASIDKLRGTGDPKTDALNLARREHISPEIASKKLSDKFGVPGTTYAGGSCFGNCSNYLSALGYGTSGCSGSGSCSGGGYYGNTFNRQDPEILRRQLGLTREQMRAMCGDPGNKV